MLGAKTPKSTPITKPGMPGMPGIGSRYTAEQFSAIDSPLSGLFQVEIASRDRASLQAAVDRLVRLIQADPNKARLDRLMPGATQTMKELLSRPDGLALTGRP